MTDYFGVDASELKKKKLWLFDMDGTIYEEDRLFSGTLDLLEAINKSGGRYVFITNNSSKSVVDYINKVNRLGIHAKQENFFTSSQATILYLKQHYPEAKVYCQGTKSLIIELESAGIDVTEAVEPVDVVLVGFDMELTTFKLRNTCEILSTQDVSYLATNPDLVCPVAFGFIPDCGSICGMIKNATGKEPKYIGKPQSTMVDIVRGKYKINADETVIVGDRLYTDIATGLNAGITAICVLTGEATVEEINSGGIRPTLTFKSVKEIYNTYIESKEIRLSKNELHKTIQSDIIRCEEVLSCGKKNYIIKLCETLRNKYDFVLICEGNEKETLQEIMNLLIDSMVEK